MKRKFCAKIVVFALSIFLFLGIVNVNAGIGYTYDSKGNPIYSTEGFTVNELPLTYADLGISSENGFSPSDLYVYNVKGQKPLVYLTDSKMNTVFVLNDNLEKIQEFDHCIFRPDDLYSTNLVAVKSEGESIFSSSKEIPTQQELDDPDGKWGGKGYIDLKFSEPISTYRYKVPLTGLDLIYICDKKNNQIVILDANKYDEEAKAYEVYQVVTKPTDELAADKSFSPKKVVVDTQGRMFVIADNVLEGIMQFSAKGKFDRYIGTNKITLTPWEIFWRNFSSEEQLATQTTLYNTEFNSLAYDPETFMIYTTSYAIKNNNGTENSDIMIKKINTTGDDIIRRNGYNKPKGDVKIVNTITMDDKIKGPSQLVGITFNEYGVYSVVDKLRGRIFTYDNEGNLLYISGGKGTQADKLINPVAIQYFGENLLVLDGNNHTIVKFEPTEIAKIINKAVECETAGKTSRTEPMFNRASKTWWIGKTDTKIANEKAEITEKDGYWYIDGQNTNVAAEPLAAANYWQQVIKLNANYEYAYVGIGHKYLDQENYSEAMKYFKLGENRVYYSKAFKQYRDGIIKKWFAPVIIVIALLIIARVVYKRVRNKKLGIKKEEETGVGDE